jgi:hypothetical protein
LTALTIKQRAKVNAALCIIHDNGFDASGITEIARKIMSTGHAASAAYEQALNSFISANPETYPAIAKITQLVEASSPATVAQYDQALSQYINTGDNAGLARLAPTIARDSVALAIHNGELTEAEAATGGLAKALGFEPGPLLQEAVAAGAAHGPKDTAATADTPIDTAANGNGYQVSAAPETGYVGLKARDAKVHHSGWAPDAPALNGVTLASAREAARASAASVARVIPAPIEGAV